jgi:hypothetical protein
MNWKNLTVAGVVLVLSVMTASALSISYSVDRDWKYSTSDSVDDPALWITGTWDLSSGEGSLSFPELSNWDVELKAYKKEIANVIVYIIGVEGEHLEGVPSEVFSGELGFPDIAGTGGQVSAGVEHGVPTVSDDFWKFSGEINPAGFFKFQIRAAHEGVMNGVPDVGSTSALLGFALAGLALIRRKF